MAGVAVRLGPLIAAGRDAEIFAAGDGKVVRRARDGRSLEAEAAIMRHVRGHGFPVPAIFDADGPDILMERVDGPNLFADAARRPWRLRSSAAVLARLHRALAAIPAPDWLPVAELFSGDGILHLDLHPLNVLCGADGPVVVDWANARRGAVGAEVASTWMILATSQIPAPRVVRPALDVGRQLFLRVFLDDIGRDAARPHLAAMAEHRKADRNTLPAEIARVDRLVARQPPRP